MRSTEPILAKRYAESRLYDTAEARYVTLDDLQQWQTRGIRFEVREAETGADIARVLPA
jgi:polyhydroxyalkanoate synthesis regulator protein